MFRNPDGSLDVTGYLQCSTPTLSEGTVAPGGVVTFSGGGFAPNSLVTVTLHSDPIVLGTTTADARGNFTLTVMLPAGIELGDHRLEATGFDPDGNPLTVTLPLTVGTQVLGGSTGGGALPRTGGDVRGTLALGCAATVIGAAVLVGTRRVRQAA